MMRLIGTFAAVIAATLRLQAAQPFAVSPLPESPYADTEVATNVPFALDCARLAALHLTLECEATATNSFEVQIGHDTDADGRLAIEEADVAFGYDCGEWFTRSSGDGVVRSSTESRSGPLRRDLAIGWRDVAPTWNLLKVIRRGPSAETSTVTLTVENRKFVLLLR